MVIVKKCSISTANGSLNYFRLPSHTESTAVNTLLAALIVIPLDGVSAKRAAEVRTELEKKNAVIGMADSLVAGICLERDGTLITRNK